MGVPLSHRTPTFNSPPMHMISHIQSLLFFSAVHKTTHSTIVYLKKICYNAQEDKGL